MKDLCYFEYGEDRGYVQKDCLGATMLELVRQLVHRGISNPQTEVYSKITTQLTNLNNSIIKKYLQIVIESIQLVTSGNKSLKFEGPTMILLRFSLIAVKFTLTLILDFLSDQLEAFKTRLNLKKTTERRIILDSLTKFRHLYKIFSKIDITEESDIEIILNVLLEVKDLGIKDADFYNLNYLTTQVASERKPAVGLIKEHIIPQDYNDQYFANFYKKYRKLINEYGEVINEQTIKLKAHTAFEAYLKTHMVFPLQNKPGMPISQVPQNYLVCSQYIMSTHMHTGPLTIEKLDNSDNRDIKGDPIFELKQPKSIIQVLNGRLAIVRIDDRQNDLKKYLFYGIYIHQAWNRTSRGSPYFLFDSTSMNYQFYIYRDTLVAIDIVEMPYTIKVMNIDLGTSEISCIDTIDIQNSITAAIEGVYSKVAILNGKFDKDRCGIMVAINRSHMLIGAQVTGYNWNNIHLILAINYRYSSIPVNVLKLPETNTGYEIFNFERKSTLYALSASKIINSYTSLTLFKYKSTSFSTIIQISNMSPFFDDIDAMCISRRLNTDVILKFDKYRLVVCLWILKPDGRNACVVARQKYKLNI